MARGRASNNARSNSMNPNSPAGRAAANNHANQGNPNNPAHPSGGTAPPSAPTATPAGDGKK